MAKVVVSLTPDELERKAEEAHSLASRYDEVLGEINALVRSLEVPHRGDYMDPFLNRFAALKGPAAQLSELMEQLSKQMDRCAEYLREIDQAVDGPFNSTF